MRSRTVHLSLLLGVSAIATSFALPGTAQATAASNVPVRFRIPPQSLATALRAFGLQSGRTIMADTRLTSGKNSPGYRGAAEPAAALRAMLRGTGLAFRRSGDVYVVVTGDDLAAADAGAVADPQVDGQGQVLPAPPGTPGAPPSPPPNAAATGSPLSDIIVTAQRRAEPLQSVPIAVTAISGQGLNDRKIETGAELLRAIPNVNFTKTNFSSFNFTIRGIGTKAISAASDPAVAVSFNSTPLIRSRLFEQEFFDISRVEVLRGPQGTLYGRNATGGVVNVLPALPVDHWEGYAWIEAGNYDSMRTSGMINVPITDTLAIRASGQYTYRSGFEFNDFTNRDVNGRDLYSTRVIAQWAPSDAFKANFIWQHFYEDDDRSRSGKALCTRDEGPTSVGGVSIDPTDVGLRARFSQACLPGSLYDDAAYGVPNGLSLPNISVLQTLGFFEPTTFAFVPGIIPGDPYEGITQTRDLRRISTTFDPSLVAKNDVYQLNLEAKLGDKFTVYSQSLYSRDQYRSSQDYNRFVSRPFFADTSDPAVNPSTDPGPFPGGIFTDPQFGQSDRVLSTDLIDSDSKQWSQEFRLQSGLGGPLEFSLGANWLDFKSVDDYFVFNNTFTAIARYIYNGSLDFDAPLGATRPCNPSGPNDASGDCIYIDPNPIASLNRQGRNYFLSRNIVKTRSAALFGEIYYKLTDNLKLTGGLRYTDDLKRGTPVPSQLLLGIGQSTGSNTGGLTAIGYPENPDIRQRWRKFTGRAVVDWKPQLSFTDETLIYGSYARGYKGGGTNPPSIGVDPRVISFSPLPATFRPEYVNAFEIGTKNTFANGRLTLNLTGFYYDYKGYQVSQIVDRISLNENFDTRSMGLELETVWRPTRNFQVDGNLGYLNTRIGKGASSIDVMNRTQGNPDWVLLRPQLVVPSNCIAPLDIVTQILASDFDSGFKQLGLAALCGGSRREGTFSEAAAVGFPTAIRFDQEFGTRQYNPLTDGPNGGRGFAADLEGNDLPNSPHLTFNVGSQYTLPINDWTFTLRADYYRQSKSFARVYNLEYDRLRAWDNLNLTFTIAQPAERLALQFYVKNVFNSTPITDVFTNSDDTGLIGNVFTLDPRIFAVRLSKAF